MASHTLTDKYIQHYNIMKKQKITNLSIGIKQDTATEYHNVMGNVKKISDLVQGDLESLIAHHNITGNSRDITDKSSYTKVQKLVQAMGVKATTIDLVGGIFCHVCKLTYTNKKEFDDHYARHGRGEKMYTCVVCFREFETYPSFRGHCYTSHVIKERHKCEYCSKYFSKLKSLRDHIKVTHIFKCSVCSKQFSSKNELVLHQVIHNTSNVPPYYCQMCEVEMATLESCKDHADLHTVNIYSCPICNENISSRDNAADHLIKHFDNVEEKPVGVIQKSDPDSTETAVECLGGIACSYCSVVSENRVEFDAHFSHEHGDKDIEYVCVVCDKSFEKYSAYACHAYEHRAKDRFCCTRCQKAFPRLSLLSTHLAVCCADGKPFACPHCERRYVTENSLRRHLRDEHHLTSLQCPAQHCRKTFSTPKELIHHQQVHSSHKNWCRQCGLAFPSLASCSAHLDVHKRKLFGCPVCNKTYRERHLLLSHLAQHFTSVLHICKVCGKVYNNRRNFMDHLKTHSEKKTHNCSYCGKGFPKLERLQQHLNIHTGSKPYRCTVCSKTFASYPNWLKHIRRMHNLEAKFNTQNPTSDNEIDSENEEDCTQNVTNLTSKNDDNLNEEITQSNETNVNLNYEYQIQDSGIETHTKDTVQDSMEVQTKVSMDRPDGDMGPETIERIDEMQDNSMEAESIIHIDIEKELQILENIPESHNNKFVDVLATDENIFDNAAIQAPQNMVPSEANNVPPEYGPEFTLGDSYGFLDLDGHMLPHIDPLLTIKTEEFNHNLPLPDLDPGMYQAPKWEPPIFTKVYPEYPYSYGDMVDSNRLSVMNTDIF